MLAIDSPRPAALQQVLERLRLAEQLRPLGTGHDLNVSLELHLKDAACLTQKPEAEPRATLLRLVEAGLVEERGQKKGRTWHLSAAAYRALGDKVAYVRQRGFEPLQQAQMVLQYVEKNGRITRRETAELCRLSPDQAYRLLTRLTGEGRLARRGSKKGAWYERHA